MSREVQSFRSDTRGASIDLTYDDDNVFSAEDPVAIILIAKAESVVDGEDLATGPGYVSLSGVLKHEIETMFTLDSARKLHEALGELIEELS